MTQDVVLPSAILDPSLLAPLPSEIELPSVHLYVCPFSDELLPSCDENWDELSWVDRLRLENTTWSSQDNNQFCPGLSVPPVWDPPFHRYRPVVQRAYRADGKRLRDGGGLGSPLLVDPASHAWADPLQVIRECIESFCV